MQIALIPNTLPARREPRRAPADYPVTAVTVGMKFGRLTVTAVRRWSTGSACDVTCDCGGGRTGIGASRLLSGNVQSCGCLHADRNSGSALALLKGSERHGRLVLVAEIAPRIAASGRRIRMGQFRCDCGGDKMAELRNVGRDLTISCGCQMGRRQAKD